MWAIPVCAAVLVILLVRWRRSGGDAFWFVTQNLSQIYGRLWKGCSCRGGRLPLPENGAAIVIANHTCSADAAFLQTFADRLMGHVMAREYYDDFPHLRWAFERFGCVLVRRDGMDVAGIPRALRRLKEGRVLCMWPEGGLSGAAKRRGRRARCGVALLALRSNVPIIPVYIAGGPRHHRVLPAWLYPSRARLYPGLPIDLSAYRGRRIDRPLMEEVTHYLMSRIFALDPDAEAGERGVTLGPRRP
jgi:1-acyl-sn-glycerol-3-phosphate acyltransferase